jgi:hypothetical protein
MTKLEEFFRDISKKYFTIEDVIDLFKRYPETFDETKALINYTSYYGIVRKRGHYGNCYYAVVYYPNYPERYGEEVKIRK